MLDALVKTVHRDPTSESMWLLYVAVSSSFPTHDEVLAALRAFELASPSEATVWLLETCLAAAQDRGAADLSMDVVTGQVVVDVDFCARHELHTGIQRVVRETVPRWVKDQEHLTLVAWTPTFGSYRHLDDVERNRVLRWSGRKSAARPAAASDAAAHRLLVPWRCTLVLAEVPDQHACQPLAALAEHSGNRVVAIGYDCIPVVSAEYVPSAEPDRFVRYLTIIKHADRVAGISASAKAEFQGFADMMPVQGLAGPAVTECELPVEVPQASDAPTPTGIPLVVVVGSHEPRKNHLAVLHAAEQLWREGKTFELRFIGGSGWATREFDRRLRRLRSKGRTLSAHRAVGDLDLWSSLRSARFTIFPSLHEGYGLPVAESLACGTPAITTDYGSTREIAQPGGALLVDPRDDKALADAMRNLLEDDDLCARLRREAVDRPPRTWDDYARELWAGLVETSEVRA